MASVYAPTLLRITNGWRNIFPLNFWQLKTLLRQSLLFTGLVCVAVMVPWVRTFLTLGSNGQSYNIWGKATERRVKFLKYVNVNCYFTKVCKEYLTLGNIRETSLTSNKDTVLNMLVCGLPFYDQTHLLWTFKNDLFRPIVCYFTATAIFYWFNVVFCLLTVVWQSLLKFARRRC